MKSAICYFTANFSTCFQVSFTENTESADDAPGSRSWIVTAFENTWTHQRRKRRAREQPRSIEQEPKNQQKDICEKYADEADYELPAKRVKEDDLNDSVNQNCSATEVCSLLKTDANLQSSDINQKGDAASHAKNCSSIEESNNCSTKVVSQIIQRKAISVDTNEAVEKWEVKQDKAYDQALPLLKCLLTVVPGADLGIAIHLDWISGKNRECLHQLMLYFKNKFQ